MKLLVVIASYGGNNDQYLHRVIDEYRAMRFQVDIVVLSNIPKVVPQGVKVVVGLPTPDPMSLPFGHKQIFFELLEDYDLFAYSEDDILITQRNIEAFLRATEVLPSNEIAGFLRMEKADDGGTVFPDIFNSLHWDPDSVRRRGPWTFAHFSNEHSGCYLLSPKQLRQAILSGGFLVPPHENKKNYYGLLESAATDPYTQCGFKKMICVSEVHDFLVLHLSNKYVGRIGVEQVELGRQLGALLEISDDARPACSLFNPQTNAFHARWSKSYYEPRRDELLRLVPDKAESVLSIGVGWGDTEEVLVKRGIRVVGLPLDSVIAACAAARGIRIIYGDFYTARAKLASCKFECLLLANILHLLDDPIGVLSSFAELLPKKGIVIASAPNFSHLAYLYRRFRHYPQFEGLAKYAESGMHLTDKEMVSRWFERCGLKLRTVNYKVPRKNLSRWLCYGPLRSTISDELFMAGEKL